MKFIFKLLHAIILMKTVSAFGQVSVGVDYYFSYNSQAIGVGVDEVKILRGSSIMRWDLDLSSLSSYYSGGSQLSGISDIGYDQTGGDVDLVVKDDVLQYYDPASPDIA